MTDRSPRALHLLCWLIVPTVLLLAGCQSGPNPDDPASPNFRPSREVSAEITPGGDAFQKRRAAAGRAGAQDRKGTFLTEGEILHLPKFVAKEPAMIDYGFSVVTNAEVLRGGAIKWAHIGVVLPDSLAERLGLVTGMKIVAINDVLIADLTGEQLVRALFQGRPGDRIRLWILSRDIGFMPVFVDFTGATSPP